MKCKIEGCARDARYKAQQLCQKHYFRFWRYGTFEIRKRADSYRTDNGYIRLFRPDHPLSNSTGTVMEHRHIMYEEYGENLPDCELCGKSLEWKTVHVDHIDEVRDNNDPSNLRPLCNPCNTRRNRRPEHEFDHCRAVTALGETKSVTEWAKDHRVRVSASCIRQRLRRGLSDGDALFMPKKTHNSKYAREQIKYHQRRMA